MSLLVEWFSFVKYLLKAFFARFQVTYNFLAVLLTKRSQLGASLGKPQKLLQSRQVKRTPQDSINELITWKCIY